MRLRCPNCNTLIPATNINVERTIAVCPKCNEVFNFGDRVPNRKAKPTERKIKQPEHVQVSETADELKIQWQILPRHRVGRGFAITGSIALLLLGTFMAFLPLFFFIKTGLSSVDWVGVWMMVVSVGIPALWGGLAVPFTSRQIVVDNHHVKDIYRPIPSFGRKFHRDDVIGILAQVNTQVTSGGRRYDVDVRLRDGTQRPFLTGLPAERAEFIVQELTRYLTQADVEEFTSDELTDETTASTFDIESQDNNTHADHLDHWQEIEQKSQGLQHS